MYVRIPFLAFAECGWRATAQGSTPLNPAAAPVSAASAVSPPPDLER
jgi:hypothetical protein